MTAPPVNTFANETGVKRNPLALYKPKRPTFKLPKYYSNNGLPQGFVTNNALMKNLYDNTGIVYNTVLEKIETDQSYMPMYSPKNTKYYNLSMNIPGERELTRNGNAHSSGRYSNVSGNSSQYLYVDHQNEANA
jgi:hypothetical protein